MRLVLTLALLLASPASAGDCETAERRYARCVAALVRAGVDPARAAAECSVRHPVRCDRD